MPNSSFDVGQGVLLRNQALKIVQAAPRTLVLQDVKTGEYRTCRRAELMSAYAKGDLVLDDLFTTVQADAPNAAIDKALSDYTKQERQGALVKLHYLMRLCPRGRVLVPRAEISGALRDAAASMPDELRASGKWEPRGTSTFYEWRRRWINSGYDTRSLVDRFDLRGRPAAPTPQSVQPFIEQAVQEIFISANRPTFKDTVDLARGLVLKHNSLVAPGDAVPLPTRRQVAREVAQRDRYITLSRRHGKAHADVATRIFQRKAEPERLLDRVEADHTPLDVIALTSADGLVARPYLTVLIDVASRMPLGFWISFRAPNSNSVLRALSVSVMPKDDILRKHKLDLQYPAYGVPRQLFLDNGAEFHSKALEEALANIGVTPVYCPARQPRFKGVVERWLKKINYRFMHLLPGTTFDRYYKRGDLDSLREAVIPLDDLNRLIWKWIVTIYAPDFHRALQTCPLERWNQLLALGKPPLPRQMEALKIFISEAQQRNLSSKGIEINTQHYTCAELADLRYRRGNMRLTVRPDPDDLGHVWVLHPESDTYFEARSTHPDYANGITVEQDDWLRQVARDRYAKLPHARSVLLAKVDVRNDVLEMMKDRDARHGVRPPTSGKSNSRRTQSTHHAQAIAEVARSISPADVSSSMEETSPAMPAIDFTRLKALPRFDSIVR